MTFNSKFIIKVPSNTQVFLCNNNNYLMIIKGTKILLKKVYFNLFIYNSKTLIYISNQYSTLCQKSSKFSYKNLRYKLLFDITVFLNAKSKMFYKKIKLKGVGYKFILKDKDRSILQLLLGFSHFSFIRLPKEFSIFIINPTLIYITGLNYVRLNLITYLIKRLKSPEVYKGKGISLEYETLILKEGKKSQ